MGLAPVHQTELTGTKETFQRKGHGREEAWQWPGRRPPPAAAAGFPVPRGGAQGLKPPRPPNLRPKTLAGQFRFWAMPWHREHSPSPPGSRTSAGTARSLRESCV